MARWSKAMFLGTSHFGCVGSSQTPFILLKCLYKGIVASILNSCTWYFLTLSMPLIIRHTGRMAKWSKVLVFGISHYGCVGSSPTPVILLKFLYKLLLQVFWTPAHVIFEHHPCHWSWNIQAGLPSGLRRWFETPVTSVAWVRVQLLSICWPSNKKYCCLYFEHLLMISSHIIHAIDCTAYRQNDREV